MTIKQTVEIPADRRLTIEVPREIPAGKVIIAFTPEVSSCRMTPEEELEYINSHAEELNAEAMDVLSYQVPLFE